MAIQSAVNDANQPQFANLTDDKMDTSSNQPLPVGYWRVQFSRCI